MKVPIIAREWLVFIASLLFLISDMNGIEIDKIRYDAFLFRSLTREIKEVRDKDGKIVKMSEDITLENKLIKEKDLVKRGISEFQAFLESGIEIVERYNPWCVRYKREDGKEITTYIMGFVSDNQKTGGIRICDL